MLNPFDPNKDTGSYISLQKRIFQRVRSSKINNQIIEVVRNSCKDAVNAEKVKLSYDVSKRFLSQILKLVLEDLSKKVDGGSTTV